jgi:hypothetical protein
MFAKTISVRAELVEAFANPQASADRTELIEEFSCITSITT